MPVYPDSKISVVVKDFNSFFYYKLCDMEYHCYTDSGQAHGGFNNYNPFFTDLSTALLNHFNRSYSVDAFRQLTQSIYTATMLNISFEFWEDLDTLLSPYSVFDLGGFLATVVDEATPVTYLDDIFMDTDPETMVEFLSAPNIEAAISNIDSQTSLVVNTKAENQADSITSLTSTKINSMLYSDIIPLATTQEFGFVAPTSPYIVQMGSPPAKSEMYDLVYVDTGYEAVFEVCGLQGVKPF